MQSDWLVEHQVDTLGKPSGQADVWRDGRVVMYDLDLDDVDRYITQRDPHATSYVMVETDGYRTTVEIAQARRRRR